MPLQRAAGLVLLCLLAACRPAPPVVHAHAVDISWRYATAAPDFRLTDPAGRVRTLAEFRDKVVVLFFGYTHCPDVCPTTLATLARLMRTLGPDASGVQVLFVTIDPQRDTPQVLAQYVPSFDASFIGLGGDAGAVAQAASAFAVTYEKQPLSGGNYAMDHSVDTYLVGRGGHVVLMSPYGQRDEFVLEDLRQLLALPR